MSTGNKYVYFETIWEPRAGAERILQCTPEGYEFVRPAAPEDRMLNYAMIRSPVRQYFRPLGHLIPGALAVSWLQKWRRPPASTTLTYAYEHVVFRPEPWVIEVKYASLLLGSRPRHLSTFGRVLEALFASPYCKQILCWTTGGIRTVVEGLNSTKFQHKVALVPVAVPPTRFAKDYAAGPRVQLLFVGSQAHNSAFEAHGGVEVLEAFIDLQRRYNNLELTMRSSIPPALKAHYTGMEGLRFVEHVIPWQEMEDLYKTADIAVLPFHATTAQTILDAMSYELPVVGRHTWGNADYIDHGKTGLLVQPSPRVPYYYRDTCHPNFDTAEFREAIRRPAPVVVEGLVRAISALVEDRELRRLMGAEARHEVEHGRFSLEQKRQTLKRIFDDALSEGSSNGERASR